jgi:hypothetical protein
MTTTEMTDERREIEELLPFYAAGVASPEEGRRVEAALERDPALRRSLDLVREDLDATVSLNEAIPAPSQRAYVKFAEALAAEPERRAPLARRASRGLFGWLEATLESLKPRQLAWSAAALIAVVALQALVVGGMLVRETATGFQTASHGEQATAGAPGVLVAFAPAATAADIATFLQRFGATVVDGPRAGLFRLRFQGEQPSAAEIDRRIGEMRAASDVVRVVMPAR